MDSVTFVCAQQPNLCLPITLKGVRRRLQFEHHQLKLPADDAQALQDAISKVPLLQTMIRVVDKKAAEDALRAHLAKQPPAAVKGATTSDGARAQDLQRILDENAAQSTGLPGADPELQKAFGDAKMEVESTMTIPSPAQAAADAEAVQAGVGTAEAIRGFRIGN